MHTTGYNISLWRTDDLTRLKQAPSRVLFSPPGGQPFSRNLWAPELHFIRGLWVIYFAADNGRNLNHRLWALECAGLDPFTDEWHLRDKLTTPDDKWSIDCSPFEHQGQLYLTWSGWEGNRNGRQNIYIAAMDDPFTVTGPRVLISSPEHPWEMIGDSFDTTRPAKTLVNEGPVLLQTSSDLFLLYSASGCWTDHYAMGMLRAKPGTDLLDPKSWTKGQEPVFRQSVSNKVFAPGHACFFKSPDGQQDYLLYHARSKQFQNSGRSRSPRIQPFYWKEDGSPNFGIAGG